MKSSPNLDEGLPGGWLTGEAIKLEWQAGRIQISDFDEASLNANSYNYRLSPHLRIHSGEFFDCRSEDQFEDITMPMDGYVLQPGECYLGMTEETFGSEYYASLITGRSSIGRKFVTNHLCAGLIDQGFFGNITLEISVIKKTRVYPGMLFGQIFWFTVFGPARLYSGKYQNQSYPTESRLHIDMDREE